MRKLLKAAMFAIAAFFILVSPVRAEGEFTTDDAISYVVNVDGTTAITHNITLTNNFTDFYAPGFSLTLHNINPDQVSAYQAGITLPVEIKKENESDFVVNISFPDIVVGQGSKRDFSIRYIDNSIATKTGEVWEISIPKLNQPDAFNKYSATLSVPVDFGELAYVSPQPDSKNITSGRDILFFGKDKLIESSVSAAFGKFQVFSFNLYYHLENPLEKLGAVELAIPPDTAFQKVIVESINPAAENVRIDNDGNWLARFILDPRQKVDVQVKGSVLIYSDPRAFAVPSKQVLQDNLKASDYWQISDPQIKNLATNLKTPQAIYNFVVNTLTYDFERVKPNVARLGALQALTNPKSAICMEFTDLFIAIARAAGIPAREVNGYAYTEDPENEPLGLVQDVLHAWPEYWDDARNIWVPIDPTWGNTTGGIDFFNKLDLRHFAFVMHGVDATQPYAPGSYKLGPEPQRDIFVEFGSLPVNREPKPAIKVSSITTPIAQDMKIILEVKNEGTSLLDHDEVEVYFDDKLHTVFPVSNLPPTAEQYIEINLPFNLLGIKMPEFVHATMGDTTLDIPTNKNTILTLNIVVLLGIIFLILLLALVRIRRVKIFYAIAKFRDNLTKKILPKRIA